MEFNINSIDKRYIICEVADLLISATELGRALGILPRTITTTLSKMSEPEHCVHRQIRIDNKSKNKCMLTMEGIKYFLLHVKLSHITNALNIFSMFETMYTNYLAGKAMELQLAGRDIRLPAGSCIYIIHIKDDYYKLGETDDAVKRLATHRNEFDFQNIVKIHPCADKTSAQHAEEIILSTLKVNNQLVKYPKKNDPKKFHNEVFRASPEDITNITTTIDKIINDFETNRANNAGQELQVRQLHMAQLEVDHRINTVNQTINNQTQILQLLNQINNKIANIELEINDMKNRVGTLELNSTSEEVVVVKPNNRPDNKLEIDLDSVLAFVQRSFSLAHGAVIGKKKLFSRFDTTIFSIYTKTAESKREFYNTLASCMISAFGVDPRLAPVGISDKDYVYGYELVCVSVEKFIEAKCIKNDKTSENADNLKLSYKMYCTELNSFGFNPEFPGIMDQLKYTSKILKPAGKRYAGIYLSQNSVNDFINNNCETGDHTAYCSFKQFELSYRSYCSSNDIVFSHIYDKNSIKAIVEENGFNLIRFNNNCINIQGIKIIGKEYDRKKKLPKTALNQIIPNNVNDEDNLVEIENDETKLDQNIEYVVEKYENNIAESDDSPDR